MAFLWVQTCCSRFSISIDWVWPFAGKKPIGFVDFNWVFIFLTGLNSVLTSGLSGSKRKRTLIIPNHWHFVKHIQLIFNSTWVKNYFLWKYSLYFIILKFFGEIGLLKFVKVHYNNIFLFCHLILPYCQLVRDLAKTFIIKIDAIPEIARL